MTISTDNWRPDWWGVEKCFQRIRELGERYVELTTATGYNLLEGLGFSPYVSVDDDPYVIRDLLRKYDLQLVSIDCDYPIWSHHCIDVLTKTIVFGDMIGCRLYVTTDSGNYPPGRSDEEWFRIIKYHFECVLPVAERHDAVIAIEPHGSSHDQARCTMAPCDAERKRPHRHQLRYGQCDIAGEDPVAFLEKVKDRGSPHAHQGCRRSAGRSRARRGDRHRQQRSCSWGGSQRRKYQTVPGHHGGHATRDSHFSGGGGR